MKKVLFGCVVIVVLAAVGIFVNYQFAPRASYAQPAPAQQSSPQPP
jgi:hypothetical protein